MNQPKDALLALLRLWEISEGADVCDRCGGTIWPEIELVRCDFCVGKHGAPDQAKVLEAAKRHRPRSAGQERSRYEE